MSGVSCVARALTALCAPGTDPEALAAVLTWSCAPRRRPDVLRRRVRDGSAGDAEARGEAPASHRIVEAARLDGRLDGPPADVALRVVGVWARLGVRVALVGDPAYPGRLAEGWPHLDAPVMLAWRGAPPGDAGPGVALVGSRNASAYGTAVTELLAAAVARAGGRVISGGALGIDAAAHAAAIGRPGGTTVVLGCGHAVPYPAPHARPGALFDRVLDDGGTLVSELLPEVTAHPGVIRARNRIVAGLAEVTVVVEGGHRSGALLTATAAIERGRDVLAVPGDITAPGSAAPLRLLGEGARACTGPRDLLALLPDLGEPPSRVAPSTAPAHATGLPDAVAVALERAGPRGIAIAELALGQPGGTGALLALLVRAKVAGIVEDVPGGVRLRTTRPSVR